MSPAEKLVLHRVAGELLLMRDAVQEEKWRRGTLHLDNALDAIDELLGFKDLTRVQLFMLDNDGRTVLMLNALVPVTDTYEAKGPSGSWCLRLEPQRPGAGVDDPGGSGGDPRR